MIVTAQTALEFSKRPSQESQHSTPEECRHLTCQICTWNPSSGQSDSRHTIAFLVWRTSALPASSETLEAGVGAIDPGI